MTTRAPNEESPRQPDAGGERNDPGIDPQGDVPAGETSPPASPSGPASGTDDKTGDDDSSTPEGNTFSPDFKSKPEATEPSSKPKDADIDTDGG